MIEITTELLRKLCPNTPKGKRDRFIPYLNEAMPRYGIDTLPRIASFLATVCFESDYLKATKEYASGKDYDKTVNPRKAKELGNTEVGDGSKYKGRGLIQLTGRSNYGAFNDIYGNSLGHPDFIIDPELLETPKWAVESACYFWHTHNLNKYADDGNFYAIQGIVNRGNPTKRAKDYPARQELYAKSIQFLQNQPITPSTRPPQNPPVTNDNTLAQGETLPPQDSVDANTPPIASPEPFFNSAKDKLASAADSLTAVESRVSSSSVLTTLVTKVGGWAILGIGVAQQYWLEILIGAALVGVAVWYWNRAKTRQNERVLAFVQDPGASK